MRYFIHLLAGTGIVLLIAGCGGRDTVASKSAAAFREAEATGKPVRGGHHHGAEPAVQTTTAMAVDHSMHQHGADAAAPGQATHSTGSTDHTSMTHAESGAPSHRHGATPTHAEHGAAHARTAATHAEHAASSPAQAGGHADHRRGEPGTSPVAEQPSHVSSPAASQHHGHPMPGDTRAGHAVTGVAPALPVTSRAMEAAQPSATLRQDPFDAPVAVSVSEAKKAGEGSHRGHGATSPAPATAAPHQHSADADPRAAQPEVTVYSCPMHPEVTSDKPGECPKCGMTLVKRKSP